MPLSNQRPSSSRVIHETPWASWVERPWGKEFWYGVELFDYVQVIARTEDGKFPLVRQFRPAVESITTEFIAGMLDGEVTPLETAQLELREEAGFGGGEWIHLDTRYTDSGRLNNKVHTFVAKDVVPNDDFIEEDGVDPILVEASTIESMVSSGELSNSIQVMGYLLAQREGHFK